MSELITKLNSALVAEAMQAPAVIYTHSVELPLQPESYQNHIYDSNKQIGVIILNDSTIPDKMFSGSDLSSVQLINITSIGPWAFENCTSLKSITIPNSVIAIGKYAFYGCTSLTNVIIPNSITKIEQNAFYHCTSLKSITIPNSVTSIGYYAFCKCTSLTSVTIGRNVTSITLTMFSGCSSLTTITIPNSVTSIGTYAFRGCTSLTSVTIPDSVTSIGGEAFMECTSLESITIPESVTEIGWQAFSGCSSLKEVYCKPTTPPTAIINFGGWDAFFNNVSDRKIYVPITSVDAYKTAQYWSDYADQIVGVVFEDEVLESGINVKTINGTSILGSGDIDISVDKELSTTSDNAISNSATTKALNTKQNTLTLTTKSNGNIVIGNLAGQSKEFMPATPSGDPMHYAYEAVGAVWNATMGYWEMYDMKDITNEEMRKAYNLGNFNPSDGSPLYASANTAVAWVRFNLPRTGAYSLYMSSGNSLASTNGKIEFINLCPFTTIETTCQIVNMQNAFYNCTSLRKIFGIIEMSLTTNTTDTFKGCSSLVDVTIKNLKQNLSFADSPLLSKESLLYMIDNCASNVSFTITLHPDVYAKCTRVDEGEGQYEGEWWVDIDDALGGAVESKNTNITLASA